MLHPVKMGTNGNKREGIAQTGTPGMQGIL
jgi:hypothetical protein